MGDDRHVAPGRQPALPHRPGDAEGDGEGGGEQRRRRIGQGEQLVGRIGAEGLGHLVAAQQGGVEGHPSDGQGLLVAGLAAPREALERKAVDESDSPVAEVEQQLRRPPEGAAVVDVHPAVAVLGPVVAAMGDEGQAEALAEVDAPVVHPGRGDDRPVDGAAAGEGLVDLALLGLGHDRQDHVVAFARIDLAGAEEEIGEDRVDDLVAAEGDDVSDRHGPAGGESLRRAVRHVAVTTRRSQHPRAGLGVDLRIAVQRPADGRGGQVQDAGKFLEFHARCPQTGLRLAPRLSMLQRHILLCAANFLTD